MEETQVLLDGSVAEGRCHTRLGGCTFLLGYLLSGLLVHIGFALFDEADSEVVELLEIVACVIDIAPLKAQPLDILHDRVHILYIFLHGVGVVEAEVANAVVLLCDTEVHADGFGMSDMQVAVGLGREARLYSAVVLTLLQVFLHNLLNEIQTFLFHRLFDNLTIYDLTICYAVSNSCLN